MPWAGEERGGLGKGGWMNGWMEKDARPSKASHKQVKRTDICARENIFGFKDSYDMGKKS